MAIYVLIHGAWHGAWCWERVTPLLEQAGHRVIAPDLPGMGEDRTPLREVSVESWSRFTADLVLAQEEPVLLVGHSRGGLIVSRAAELAHHRVAALVYVAAFLVRDGQTLEQVMRQIPPRSVSVGSLEFSEDSSSSTIAPDAVTRVFYNRTSPDLVARAAALSGPEPMASFTTPIRVSQERWGAVPRYYVECTQDRAIAPELQRRMQEELPCRRTFRIDCDHSPFYSAPAELAHHLLAVARELPAGAAIGRASCTAW